MERHDELNGQRWMLSWPCAAIAIPLLLFTDPAFCQGGLTCATAELITEGSYTYAVMTDASTPDNGCGDFATKARWYRFVAPEDGELTVKSCDLVDTYLTLHSACGTCTAFNGNDGDTDCHPDGWNSTLTYLMTSGEEVWIQWKNSFSDAASDFSVTFDPMAPDNDSCLDAIVVSGLPYTSPTIATTDAADGDETSIAGYGCNDFGGVGGPYKNVWWVVTGVCGPMTATTCHPATSFDTEVAVYSGSCGGLVYESCSDNDPTCPGGPLKSTAMWTATQGVIYYIAAGSMASFSPTGTLVLSIMAIDGDGDGVGDPCDICPGGDDNTDADEDGIPDGCDDCPLAVEGIANFDEDECACELGYFATVTDMGGNDVVTACTICPPGNYCPDGIDSFPCAAGYFSSLSGQMACTPCPGGTFSAVLGSEACTPCEPGYANELMAQTSCTACPPGSFSDGIGQLLCSLCPANTYNPDFAQTECPACEEGESSGVGATECTPEFVCTTDLDFVYQADGVDDLIWAIYDQITDDLVQSGGGTLIGNGSEATCVPDGCFYLVVTDGGGDGIVNGGYFLRTTGPAGMRIVDNRNNFTDLPGGPPDVSQMDNGEGFCVPFGVTTQPIYTSCDKLDWVSGQYIVCRPIPAMSVYWSIGSTPAEAITGYEFQIFNPNGGYIYNRFRSHSVSDGFAPDNASRACHMKINNWSVANHIPANVLMNVRVRTRINGVNGNWGAACRFKIDPVQAACPLTNLMDIPGNANLSCNSTRAWGNGNYIHARPVSGATQYQWRFRIDAESFVTIRTTTTYFIQLNWPTLPLQDGKTYSVEVRAFKGGAWCVDAAVPANCGFVTPCWVDWNANKPCLLTIDNTPFDGGNENSLEAGQFEQGEGLRMYPNPNRGDQLYLSLDGLGMTGELLTITVDITDMFGKRMSARTIPVTDGFINTVLDLDGGMANGMYLVHITAGEQRFTERLVIQK